MQIRQAAATAREALLGQAATRLGVTGILKVVDAVVAPAAAARRRSCPAPARSQGVRYAELVGGKRLDLAVDAKAPLKPPADYTIVGKPVPRLDIPDKVIGRFTTCTTSSCRHAAWARGAAAGDEGEAAARSTTAVQEAAWLRRGGAQGRLPGRRRAHRMGRDPRRAGAGGEVVGLGRAAGPGEALGVGALGQGQQGRAVPERRATRPQALAAAGARTFSASYDFPVHTHGSLGPSCAVADYKDGKLTCWTASQATHNAAQATRQHAGDEAGGHPLHLPRGLRLLRPQRA